MQQMLRLAAVGAVLFGILLMHSSPILPSAGDRTGTSAHATGTPAPSHDGSTGPAAVADTMITMVGAGCESGGDCAHHSGLHLCMAVVAIAAMLVLSRWHVGTVVNDPEIRPRVAWLRRRAGRAPPWTTPTLAQLSVWRV
ncbi:membrane protein (plasmid) [Rhodococcus opacus]|uniref:Membrane protein n=2 Tax=Rhodococcus opacus TaxID=37919 RepID=A0A076F1A4_RHOOP|nr:membrane protein [Rhodococcus opacus]